MTTPDVVFAVFEDVRCLTPDARAHFERFEVPSECPVSAEASAFLDMVKRCRDRILIGTASRIH